MNDQVANISEQSLLKGLHPSHDVRMSDASTFDYICKNCGATDDVPGGWGQLSEPCSEAKQQ